MSEILAYFNNNDGSGLLAIGEQARFVVSESVDFRKMQQFLDAHQGAYIFSCLSYDLKSETLNVDSNNEDYSKFPLAVFWVPEFVAEIKDDQISEIKLGTLDPHIQITIDRFFDAQKQPLDWNARLRARTSEADYIETVKRLLDEIQFGNIYEVNYCQEFYDDDCELENPEAAYFKLNNITGAPFSAYVAFDQFRVLCGSPERYIRKKQDQLISQPIKGTSKRGRTPEEDELFKRELAANPKEQSENVMIVDLVRNDLSKIAQTSSVQVDELFGVYTFNTVHQMISTISCKLKPEANFTEILKATYPMGSMTGAPKKSAVELIEKHENFRRGLYSGSIGYIAPNGDFDFNVVIRTLIYNQDTKYLSCAVGGAITIQSTPEAEYEECNVKVKTILDRMHA